MTFKEIVNFLIQYILPPLLLVLLFYFGAFFTSSETAFTSLSKIKVRQMLKDEVKNAKRVAKLRDKLDRVISTTLIGTNFMTTLITSLMTAYVINCFGEQYVKYGTVVVIIISIVFMEIIPKTSAAFRPEETSSKAAFSIDLIQKIFFPVVFVFDQIGNLIDLIEKIGSKKKPPLVTEEELKTLLDLGKNEGTIDEDERKMLDRIFEFSDIQVHDMMKHRSLVHYVKVGDSLESVVEEFEKSGYSRLPVCQDNLENVVGVLHYKSVVFAEKEITSSPDFVKICMSHVVFVPETMYAVDLLRTFKKQKENFAVAVNEYGSIAGVVTMDDILREVFGRMTDEYGSSEVAPEKRIQVVNTNEFIIPGDMKTDDVNEVLNLKLESENFDTIGGWLLERFDELPPIGAVYRDPSSNTLFIVEDQSGRRIQQVRLKFGF